MREIFAFVLALLLCGCSAQNATVPAAVTEPTAVPTAGYHAGSPLEIQTKGAVRAHPLELPDAYHLMAVEGGLLVFSLDGGTCMTLLTEEALTVAAQASLPFMLSAQDPSLQCTGSEISYYDPTIREILVLDRNLTVSRGIAVPEDLVGSPILSEDRKTLYYCTSTAVRAWDLESGIRRCLKDMAYDVQSVSGLYLDGTVVGCTINDGGIQRTLFLSADTGSLLWEHTGEISLETFDGSYYAAFPSGYVQTLVFGGDTPTALTPRDLSAKTVFLPRLSGAVSRYTPSEDRIRLDYYDLTTGNRTSTLEWDTESIPNCITAASGYVYILTYDEGFDQHVLYRWDPSALPANDVGTYTGTYHTPENLDAEGLERCRTYAGVIGQQHGIQVKIGWDATAVQPWDYHLEPEYLVPVLEEELHLLEERLAHYPKGMLADTASHFSSLTICLVRSITGSAESGSLDAATGIQFFDGSDAYVVIAPGKYAQQSLYHEMFHVMETHLLTRPTALDRWEELNPNGFRYDYSYITNKGRDSGIYLQNASRAFIDTYSMSFPKEDRARVLEYAMLPGQESLFQSETMQKKLQCLSTGLREAYGLEDSKESFLWEQYLDS